MKLTTQNHVKALVRNWCEAKEAFHFAVVQNGLGTHGIHDRIACLPLTVTPEMVGKKIGLFVSIEAKRPGRRAEKDSGMSKHQVLFMENVLRAGGLSIVCDGLEDLSWIDDRLRNLVLGFQSNLRSRSTR